MDVQLKSLKRLPLVRLGPAEWSRHTYPRPPGDRLRLIGSIQAGAAVGALAVTEDGRYLQVNGDHERPLGCSTVRAALLRAEADRPSFRGNALPRESRPAPTVIVRRKRFVAPDAKGESSP